MDYEWQHTGGSFVGGEVEVGDHGGVSEPQEASRGHSQI